MTPLLGAATSGSLRLRQLPRRQVSGEGLVPNRAQMDHTQIQNHLSGYVPPTHPRTFETLREYGLAGRFRHAAADRQSAPPIALVVHPATMTTEVAIRFLKLRLVRLDHPATTQVL